MPPGVVSFTIHSGLPPVSFLTLCHFLSAGISLTVPFGLLGMTQTKTQKRDSLRISEEGDGNSAACDWVIHLLQTGSNGIETSFLRTNLSGTVWSLLGQSRCEKRGVKGRERKKGFAQSTSCKFSPSSAFSHTVHYPSCTTFLSVSASCASSAAFKFSISPFFSNVIFYS